MSLTLTERYMILETLTTIQDARETGDHNPVFDQYRGADEQTRANMYGVVAGFLLGGLEKSKLDDLVERAREDVDRYIAEMVETGRYEE